MIFLDTLFICKKIFHSKKKEVFLYEKKIGLFLCFSILLTGCQGFETTPSSITLPAKETEVHTVMQRNVERMAEEKHVPAVLSDDFCERYLDMDNMKVLEQRTIDGIAATQSKADMTEQEIQLWNQIIRNKQFTQYTSEDIQAKESELTGILDELAKEHQVSLDEYLHSYGMTQDDMEHFVEKQAGKYGISLDPDLEKGRN